MVVLVLVLVAEPLPELESVVGVGFVGGWIGEPELDRLCRDIESGLDQPIPETLGGQALGLFDLP